MLDRTNDSCSEFDLKRLLKGKYSELHIFAKYDYLSKFLLRPIDQNGQRLIYGDEQKKEV